MTGFESAALVLLVISLLVLVTVLVLLVLLIKRVAGVDEIVKKGLDDLKKAALLLVGNAAEDKSAPF